MTVERSCRHGVTAVLRRNSVRQAFPGRIAMRTKDLAFPVGTWQPGGGFAPLSNLVLHGVDSCSSRTGFSVSQPLFAG